MDDLDRHAADPDCTDLALVAQRDHLGKLVVEIDDLIALRLQPRPEVEATEVHHVNPVEPQLRQVGLDGGPQLGGLLGGGQSNGPAGDALGADLADDHQVVAVRSQRRTDAAVDLSGRIERRGVDVVHAELDRALQQGDRGVVRRRPRFELHGAVADPRDLSRADSTTTAGS